MDEQIIDDYIKCELTLAEMQDKYNISRENIWRILESHNIPKRERRKMAQRYNIDDNYFDNIDTKNKAYILGFLWADGCNKDNESLYVKIQERDREILEYIKKEMKSTHPIHDVVYKGKTYCYLAITNKHIINVLNKMGFCKNKTEVISIPKLREDLYSHFMRGLYDGDGSIICKKNKGFLYKAITIEGSRVLIESLHRFLNERGFKHNYSSRKNSNNRIISMTSYETTLKFGFYLYNDYELCLSRKRDKFAELILYASKGKIDVVKLIGLPKNDYMSPEDFMDKRLLNYIVWQNIEKVGK